MEQTQKKAKKKGFLWSILSVVGGFFTVAFLSVFTDFVFEGLKIFPSAAEADKYQTWMLVVAFAYRSAYTVVGGYVAAMLAPHSPMKHVLVLATLGTIGGILGVIVGWNLSEKWYPIAIALTGFPLVWYGGKLRLKKRTK